MERGCSDLKVYLVAYAPTSPHRLVDLAKIAYSVGIVRGFIVVKPVGIAAQVGVPEVFRIAYKLGKNFLVLSHINELKELLSISNIVFMVQSSKEANDVSRLLDKLENSVAIVVQAGEAPFAREDLSHGYIARIQEFDDKLSPNAVAEATASLLKIYAHLQRCDSGSSDILRQNQ
ncbi:MAG: RecB-family nuclease [Ignisphaera sp.]|nr:RecB-family nuclease [Ignisphaera sp.]MCX8168564.1 RecB-family nuclease [Ignisphaera sp.]MDW8085150.1 RecB-family nuclease [Ignisphaera sp.]